MKGEIVWEIDAADIFIEQSELDPKWVKAVRQVSFQMVWKQRYQDSESGLDSFEF